MADANSTSSTKNGIHDTPSIGIPADRFSMSADILDRDSLSNIRQALLIGLSSFGEIERLTDYFALMGSEDLPEGIRPTHPTGSPDTINKFADALRMVQLAYDSAKS